MTFIKKIVKRIFDFGVLSHLYHLQNNILRRVARLNSIAYQHQKTFAEYKNAYVGKDIAIIGAGPSVRKFKTIPNCIYIGLNSACVLDTIKFDFLFTIDKMGIDKIYPEFATVNCTKFVGDQNLGALKQIPESEIAKMGNVKRYKTDAGLWNPSSFSYNIESEPLGNFNTVSLQALQFALYTNPRKIYLVGIDCSTKGHFSEKQGSATEWIMRGKQFGMDLNVEMDISIKYWTDAKTFAETFYPETEIISVNPVGLRGLFKDLDQ